MSKTSKRVMSLVIAIILFSLVMVFIFAPDANAINVQLFDFNYNFKYAVVMRADGEQLIELKSWTDYEDSDVVQFTSTDGITYLTHYSNVILLSDKER